eukprot:gene10759-13173_t
MQTLNREIFKQTKNIVCLVVSNKQITSVQKEFKGLLIQRPKFKPIIPYESDDQKKVILLNEDITQDTDLPNNLQQYIKNNNIEVSNKEVNLDYNNFSYEQVLKRLLPENVTIPFAFERIGHIAHLNLRDEQLPFKNLIGQAILDKNPQVKTVLNKVGKIDTVFRTFKIEVLAGENDLIAEIKENECIFRFNFEEVYWNSRLQYEHWNLIKTFTQKDIICDMFAGVGPFAVPAAKVQRCIVYANDLNPSSTKYMKENAKFNKVEEKVSISNMDARDFVKSLLCHPTLSPKPITQVIMNLPSTSIEFLDVFRDIFLNDNVPPPIPPPTIHCYTFTKSSDDLIADTKKNVEQILNYSLPENFECFEVRDVAPKKRMMRISFKMPTKLPFNKSTSTTGSSTVSLKRDSSELEKKNNEQEIENGNKKIKVEESSSN